MNEIKVEMTVRQAAPHVAVIDIQGEVTSQCEATLMNSFAEAAVESTKGVVLNFAGLEYMNSGGIGLLVTLLIRAQRQQRKLLAYGLNEHYQQIFELTRLNEAIGIFSDEAEALTSLTGPAH